MKKLCWVLWLCLSFYACTSDEPASPVPDDGGSMYNNPPDNTPDPENTPPKGFTVCEDGMAGPYPCNGFDLLGRLDLEDLRATSANDIWGWTDPDSGKEYALVGLNNGTAFVDITDTDALRYVGKLPTATGNSAWRDIKVFQDHAFIVSEADGHGMQVFDLTQLRDATGAPASFEANTRYTGFGNAHNIVINSETGYAYAVGTARNDIYNGGVHFIDINDPLDPTAAGGYGSSGYTHDAQVVSYSGTDTTYEGREIFIGANENLLVLVDVTDKGSPALITNLGYPNIGYTHQGWFTDDHLYFILGDETDEINFGFASRTLVFDMSDLDDPQLHTTYLGPTPAIDHNGYVKDTEFYLSNYTAGIRLLNLSDIGAGTLSELAYFDSYPANNNPSFDGVWSVYPFFESGKVVINDINSGIMVLQRTTAP
jgi:choice-of-anchor B domain-containing protein